MSVFSDLSGNIALPAKTPPRNREGSPSLRSTATVIPIPGSKSIMARALFLAAAAEGRTTLRDPLWSDDTEGFAEALKALGYQVHQDENTWIVDGSGHGPTELREPLLRRCGAGLRTPGLTLDDPGA
ncbi:hypothetical protein ACIBH1_08575 [Nonomuraea sp. NPDC050663]|uniref:hypothetical protein n=1 Tax=Nonomuraea sp. NPDC050663 TaxID=3364370 RepID=UPI0037893204